MSAAVATIEPLTFRSGETVKWTKSLSDYTYADGWRLTYYLRGKQSLDISTTADTDSRGFSVTISALETASLEAGNYWMEGRVTLSGETYVVYKASVTIEQDFSDSADVGEGYDGRTHARRMLDSIESAMADTAGNFMVSYEISGERSVTLLTPEQYHVQHAYWETRVKQEEKAERIARGSKEGVFIRFQNAR